ncbi:MAG: glycoside hydrolase [Clostridiales bacterium]|jgi:kojibiose phosphorylase|nr:glycoside hydrolase [Clostridiales bacterium]
MGMNTWKICEEAYNEKLNKNYEGLFTQGNGYLSIRGSFEEDLSDATQNDRYWRMPANVTLEKQMHPKSKWGVFVPGVVGNHPILNEEMVNLPYILGLNIYIDDSRFDMEESDHDNYNRELDLKTGALSRRMKWLINGKKIELNFLRYISMARKNIIVQQLRVKSIESEVRLKIQSFIEGDVTTNGYNHFVVKEVSHNNGIIECYVKTDLEDEIIMMSRLLVTSGVKEEFQIIKDRVIHNGIINIRKGQEIVITKISVIKTNMDKETLGNLRITDVMGNPNFIDDAGLELKKAVDDVDKLYGEHVDEWKKRWDISDVEIQGDDRSQLAVRFSIYHLLRSVNEGNDRVAIDAKGAAGEAYFGHYFWDTEIYLLPFYLYTNPAAAKNLLMFRYNTLEAAKQNAKSYGYSGAKYPWESSISGKEQCSNWQYKDLEIHISADIVYAMWHYYRVTGDKDTLFNYFIDVMYEISRFWISRADIEKDGTYSIRGVMGPDEYLAFTNNNAFTNYMVKHALKRTLETLKMIKNEDEELYINKSLNLKISEEELEMMNRVMNKLNMPIDNDKHFIWQCEDFEGFVDLDFDKVWIDRSKPFGQFISQEKNYRSKALKQADVIGLLWLFNRDFDNEMVKNCMDYYEPITTHDSSLSYIIHSIVYSQMEDRDLAYEFFKRSLGIDLYDYGAAEGIHIANCGGIWQAVIYGFCGLNNLMVDEDIKLKPALPEGWERVKFRLLYNDRWYNITVSNDEVVLEYE